MNYYTESAASFWIPASEAGAGSISSEGNIVSGTNTFFTIQLESGDWIVDSSGNSAQVRTVVDDTTLEVYGTSNVSGSLEIIKGDNAKNLFLGVKNKAGADITIDGVTVVDGDSKVFGQQNSAGYRRKFVAPKFINNSAEGQILINIERNTNLRRMSSVPFIPGLFDPDYQAVLDYATTEGYTLPSAGQQTLQNQLVLDLKAAGVWDNLDAFSVFATDGDSSFALIDWIRLTTQTAINSPTFTTNQGYQGDGVSSYIDTLYDATVNAVNLSLTSTSYGYYTNDLPDSRVRIGALGTDTNHRCYDLTTDRFYIHSKGVQQISGSYSTGFQHFNRSGTGGGVSDSDVEMFINGAATTITAGAGAQVIPDNNFCVLARGGASGGNSFSSNQLSVSFIGGSLSPQAADFNTAIQTYITSI